MNTSGVTVSVVSHEHFDEIPNLLKDLSTYASETINSILVTLNIQEPELKEWINAQKWPFDVIVIQNKVPMGYGTNHNQAFDYCRSPYFCVVNPDVRLSANPFPALISAIDSDKVGCVYPMQSDGRGLPIDRSREIPSPLALFRRHSALEDPCELKVRHWINGAFMLFPSSVFSEIGKFDPRYYMYCEDVEICLRLQVKGFQLIPVANAHIEHVAQHASRRRVQHFIWHLQSLWRLWHSESYRKFSTLQRN